MARKGQFKFSYDAPVSITFVLVVSLAMILDYTVLRGWLTKNVFTCRGIRGAGGMPAFDFKNGFDYLRLLTHIFGSAGWEDFLINTTIILLLGPAQEERYGSAMFALMTVVSGITAGVLSVCAGVSLNGPGCIIFTLILLASITAFSRRTIEFSWILVFVLYTSFRMYASAPGHGSAVSFLDFLKANVPTFINLVAGVAGSLFAFMASPKKRKSSGLLRKAAAASDAGTVRGEGRGYGSENYYEERSERREQSVRRKSSPRHGTGNETVVGTIDL